MLDCVSLHSTECLVHFKLLIHENKEETIICLISPLYRSFLHGWDTGHICIYQNVCGEMSEYYEIRQRKYGRKKVGKGKSCIFRINCQIANEKKKQHFILSTSLL